MKRILGYLLVLFVGAYGSGHESFAQARFIDVKTGFSVWSGYGSSTSLVLGAGVDIPFENVMIRPEFNFLTFSGTPVEIAGLIKYNLTRLEDKTVYINGGPGIWFMTGGPYLGIDFGGGIIFPLQGSEYSIPVDLRLGPVFTPGTTVFQVTLTGGIRFSL